MGNCRDIESRLAAYVDGEAQATDRGLVETHLEQCPRCRHRVASERTTHDLLASRRDDLRGCASEALHHRCAAQRALAAGRARFHVPARTLVSLSLAATVLLAVSLFLAFGWGSAVDTYAAQLADDHVNCFRFAPQAGVVDAASLSLAWQERNGWALSVAPGSEAQDLHLVDLRRCGSSEGDVAHVLYRWQGAPLSVYVLNGTVEDVADATHDSHAHDTLSTHGEQAVMWTKAGRTYTVVARERASEVERIAEYFRNAIE